MSELNLKIEHTCRGFAIARFPDGYGYGCSIQESSAASQPMLWLGVNNPNAKIFPGDNTGWHDYPLPDNVSCTTRMHLTQDHAAALIPLLQCFVDTGRLVRPTEESESE